MKRFFLTFTLVLLTNFIMVAQEEIEQFIPYYTIDGQPQGFERIGAKLETKVIGFGYGGVNKYLTVFNEKYSPVRFKKGELPKFLIEIDDDTDPLELVVISKADIVKKEKKYRRFVQGGTSLGGGSKTFSGIIVPVLKKVQGNVYEIIVDDLEEGEYSFVPIYLGNQARKIRTTSGSVRIYCFGVDE